VAANVNRQTRSGDGRTEAANAKQQPKAVHMRRRVHKLRIHITRLAAIATQESPPLLQYE